MHTMDMNISLENKEGLKKQVEDLGEQLRSLGYPDEALAGNKEFQKLARAYNPVLEEIHRREEEPRFDPMERLPEEVWLMVLKEAVTKHRHGSFLISTELVLFLTSVSLKWRDFIESAPSLWNDIVLYDNREDLAMKVTISLLFSRDASLTVQFVGPLQCWSQVQSIVLPHKDRIRNIYLTGWGDHFQDFFFSTLPQLCTPQLRSIDWLQFSVTDGRIRETFLSRQSEHIHSIFGIPLTKDAFDLPTISNLRGFFTAEDAKCVLGISETLSRLEEVDFQSAHGAQYESKGIASTTTPLHWSSLTYSQGVMATLTSLLGRLPLLSDLIVDIQCDELPQLMSSMRDLKVLYRLEIRCYKSPTRDLTPPRIMDPLRTVRKLTFAVGDILDEDGSRRLSRVSDYLVSLIPNLEVLHMSAFPGPIVHQLSSEAGFQKVHTLVLKLRKATMPLPLGNLHLSTAVKTFCLEFDGAIVFFARGLENLRVFRLDLHNVGGNYSTVQKLHFIKFEDSSNDFQLFTSLTEVSVDGDEVTRFCHIIATDPDTCPSLDKVSLGRFPDLDILLIMLERRNLTSSSGRARIRTLELPTPRPLATFKTLRDLLRGHIVERQSNFEASLHGSIDIICDRNIPGCIDCHKAQIFCNEPVSPYWNVPDLEASSIPPYPVNIEDILSTWKARSLMMEGLIQYQRLSSCRREKDLTRIADDSLEWPVTRDEIYMATSTSQGKKEFSL